MGSPIAGKYRVSFAVAHSRICLQSGLLLSLDISEYTSPIGPERVGSIRTRSQVTVATVVPRIKTVGEVFPEREPRKKGGRGISLGVVRPSVSARHAGG